LSSCLASSGTLLCRFGILCARHLCRRLLGNASSKARTSPGAPSVTPRIGSASPRLLRSRRTPRQLAVSSLVPGARPNSTLQPPGNAVDKQVQHLEFRQVPHGKGLVVGPERAR
jgi:hypothetical protein